MCSQLIMAFVVVALNRSRFDRSVHPLNLTIGPRMVGFRQQMLDPIGVADHVKAHRSGTGRIPVPGLLGELDAVICETGLDLVKLGSEHMLAELPSRSPVGIFHALGHSELTSAVSADEQI
jgi:hypothetical protein